MLGTAPGGEADTLPKGGPRGPPVLLAVQRAGGGGEAVRGVQILTAPWWATRDQEDRMLGGPGCSQAPRIQGFTGPGMSGPLWKPRQDALPERRWGLRVHSVPVLSTPLCPTPPV